MSSCTFQGRSRPVSSQDADLEQRAVLLSRRADRMSTAGWGHAVDGLRSRVLVPVGRKEVGEQVPVVVTIQNQVSSQSAYGSAVLAPIIRLDVSRNGWCKSIFLPVHQLNPDSYTSLEKGKEFHYALDLVRVVDLDVPGRYLVTGGYDSSIAVKFKSAWKGGRVTSPPYTEIKIVEGRDRATTPVEGRRQPEPRQVRETAWGKRVRGLCCKVSVRTGSYAIGEPIPAAIIIKNFGTPDSSTGRAQLFPHLDLWMKRAGWEKHVKIQLGVENRVWITKGGTFSHALDLSQAVDMTVPGEYAVSGGHFNAVVSDLGDWTGTVRSPFQGGIIIVDE